jgi:hypothetical protein
MCMGGKDLNKPKEIEHGWILSVCYVPGIFLITICTNPFTHALSTLEGMYYHCYHFTEE